MIRIISITLIVIAIFVAVFISWNSESSYFSEKSSGLDFLQSKKLSLAFVGDIMLSRDIGKLIAAHGPEFPFVNVKKEIAGYDITFGNLENPVSTKGKNMGSMYSFRADPATLTGLSDAGFDIVSFANNHVFDYGPEAFLDSITNITKVGILVSGAGKSKAEAHAPVIISKNGVKVAFLSYSQFASASQQKGDLGFAVAGIDTNTLVIDIARAKDMGANIVITSFHWGDEYEKVHNAYQERIARAAIDAGADLVVGHHPHVIQDTEWYKGKFIAYSLGNFIFDQNFSNDTREGGVLDVHVENKAISSVLIKKVHFSKDYQPFFVTE